MNRFILFVFLNFVVVISFSQQIISGKIIDSEFHVQISNAYIENISKQIIVEADSLGKFAIKASIGDTLIFSSVGYYWKKYVIYDYSFQVYMLDMQVYDLEQIVKRPDINYEQFKYKILSMKSAKDTLHVDTEFERYFPMRNYTPGTIGYTFEGGITNIYNTYNRHARNALKALELFENQHYIILANKKFNKELVVDLTHIPPEYFNDFIAYCSFSDEYLALASEYQIITMLFVKYDEYVSLHPQIKNYKIDSAE